MMAVAYARARARWLAAALLLLAGCNAQQLRFTTMRLSETIPELQERQVIDNFARIAADPGALPYYTVINAGTVNIDDNGSGGLSALALQHRVYPAATLGATASRTVTGNWTLNPMTNPDRLRAMRAAYQIALGAEFVDPVDQKRLDAVWADQKDLVIPRGWIRAGTKHDVPHRACIVARCGHTYVWVVPGHSREFADFALIMMNIATWIPPSPKPQPSAPRALEALPRARPSEAPEAETPAIQMRLYEDSSTINRGLFFVPR